ncbi:hypothetical protein [Mycobacterium sp. 141]|uniref:hypothetical protein n=1 Tax=Mycobacterium sp. 141 TaxID=1120797 RepID=UPI0012DCA0ED|nr:hypothetical protein [Mycobacterium sp. 141]
MAEAIVTVDERVVALRRRHAREAGQLMSQFVAQHPDIEVDVDNADWTPEQEQAWREFTAAHREKCRAERAALAAELGIFSLDQSS